MSTYPKDLVRLDKPRSKNAAEVLARAFHAYPLFQYYFPDELERNTIAPHFLSIALNIVIGGLLVKGYVSRIVILEANLIRSLDSLDFRSILRNDRSP
ncbi:MAG: hypothetical protein JRF35_09935 [Deltaproteobacteria bacterium]|nr:hypothetical protein [Deltaproteobacteria bacterium]